MMLTADLLVTLDITEMRKVCFHVCDRL